MSADVSEVEEFAIDLGRSGGKVLLEVERSVFKGAMAIKRRMAEELQSSQHFRSIAKSVDFDIESRLNGVEAEIGPKSGPREPGNLANIAYFGTSRGGGTVDFLKPFEEEKPRFEQAIQEVLRDIL